MTIDLQVERWPIERLIPYARNARTHSAEQVAQIAASIVEFGWTNPILLGNDGVVIAGHARLLAARKLGLSEVPKYCDVIVNRWQQFTGKQAGLATDGRTFEQVAYDRTETIAV